MKIVFVENIDPRQSTPGGIGTYLRNLALFLKENGIPTALVGAGEPGEGEGLHIPVDEVTAITKKKGGHPGYILQLLKKVRKIKLDGDVILHGQRPDVLFPFVLFKRGRKIVCSLHGVHGKTVSLKRGKMQGLVYGWLEKAVIRRVHKLIAVGKQTEDYFIAKYPYCKDKIVTIPTGVDAGKFRSMDNIDKKTLREKYGFDINDKILLYAGRLEKEKQLAFLVDVFAGVKEKIPQAKLVLVGTGREEKGLKEYVSDGGIEDVVFWGQATRDLMPEILNCADVFTLTSLYEGSPTVVKEALACNLPVGSVDVGDVRDIIGNLEGCFIARRDVREFAGCVADVLRGEGDHDFTRAMAAYSNETVFKQTLELYEGLFTGK
ncbi:MAG: glycosyltransferase family 4 protein [bacterium]|nr:glycosyltransferase family 4 protein [bacterium]